MAKTYTHDDIISYTGADNWDHVVREFANLSYDEILDELNNMFPQDDNEDLARAIYQEV